VALAGEVSVALRAAVAAAGVPVAVDLREADWAQAASAALAEGRRCSISKYPGAIR
jgi:hypothetical protein